MNEDLFWCQKKRDAFYARWHRLLDLKKKILEIDRLRSKAEEAVNALDVSAFNNFKAAVKVALESQRKENLKDLQRLNARIDKLKDKVKDK